MEGELITIDEAGKLMRCSRVSIYARVKEGRISLRKLGRRSFLLRSEVEAFLRNLPTATFRVN